MITRTLFLDSLILASASFPSGFTGSVSSVLRLSAHRATTAILIVALVPFVIVFLSSFALHPELFFNNSVGTGILILAIVAAGATLLLEWGVQNSIAFAQTGTFWRGIKLHQFWTSRVSAIQFLLITLIALGEEVVFRQIWIGVLEQSFGFAALVALIASSILYGINHLYLGWSAVLAKTTAGFVYGGFYILSGSLWPAFIAHALQNGILLCIAAGRDA